MKIQQAILRQMTEHARAEMPNECCGLLFGKHGLIDGIRLCQNEYLSPSAFRIPNHELFDFFRSLRENGKEFLGIYHSHPDGTLTPSERDAEEFYYRDASYWIVSLHNGLASVRCFQWKRMRFVEVPYVVKTRSEGALSNEKSSGKQGQYLRKEKSSGGESKKS